MSNDFLPSNYNLSMELGRGRDLIPRIRKLEEAFLGTRQPVIYVTDRHLKTDFELEKWGPHSMKGKEGSKIVEGLITEKMHVLERTWNGSDIQQIKKGELLFEVEKGTYSGFIDNGGKPTALAALLTRIGFKPGDRVCITGVHTNCCVMHTAADARFRGYIPVIVEDCVDAFDDSTGAKGMGHHEALNYMRYWYDSEVKTSKEIKAELESGTTQDRRGL